MDTQPNQRLLAMLGTLYNTNTIEIQKKINAYLKDATESVMAFLIPLLTYSSEAMVQVLGSTSLEREIRFPITNVAIETSVSKKCSISSSIHHLDQELHKKIKSMVPKAPTKVLIVPILHPESKAVCLLVGLVNYKELCDSCTIHTVTVNNCFQFCLGIVLTSLSCDEEKRIKKQYKTLLTMARNLFSNLGDYQDLMQEIVTEARKLTNAERCSLFTIDGSSNYLVAKIFDGEVTVHSEKRNHLKEVRMRQDQGVAGYVYRTGELLNIKNAYSHPLFFRGVDEATGFKTRNILCFPIKHNDAIVGVVQLCNKQDGLYFNIYDEEVAVAFGIYCGISMMHGMVYKKIQEAQARSKIANELMTHHMKVSTDDVVLLTNCSIKHNLNDILDWSFSPRSIPDAHTACYVLKFFEDLGFTERFKIGTLKLARFILLVKKGYRSTPYHNWMHAFSVTHFCYALIKNFNLITEGYITDLEGLAFMISCLGHDLDHRGTNNSFQKESGTVLARLYSSDGSVMERHHLALTLCLLNSEECGVLEGLTREEYNACLDNIQHIILSTDLSHHFRVFKDQTTMAKHGIVKSNPRHRILLIFLLMNACDLNDQTKDWKLVVQIAEQIYQEFFSQGDLEKSMGQKPLEMMDRDRAKIPELQIQFLKDIVLPIFELLAKFFPGAKCLVDQCRRNKVNWKEAFRLFSDQWAAGRSSMDLLVSPELVHLVESSHTLR